MTHELETTASRVDPGAPSAIAFVNPDDVPIAVFLKTFSAAHLARPLLSFDADATDDTLTAAMTAAQVPVVSLRSAGLVDGWRTLEEIGGGVPRQHPRPFDPGQIISEAASLHEVISRLAQFPWLFVRSLQQVNGVIQLGDIDRPPMRMWLFGLITVMELRVNRLIDELLPAEEWVKYLSPGRRQKARDLQQECQRHGDARRLIECLQFADKGRIISCHEELRQLTRFETKRQVEDFAYDLQQLRNRLSHALALSDEWATIVDLANHISRLARVGD